MGKMKDMAIVYCDCIQVITDWSYDYCMDWISQHSTTEVENFIKENW